MGPVLAAIGPLVLGRIKFMVVCRFLLIILEPWLPRIQELVGSLWKADIPARPQLSAGKLNDILNDPDTSN